MKLLTKQLGDSAIFKDLIVSNKLKSKLGNINFEEATVDHREISSEISTIERRMKHPTRMPVLNLYEQNKVIVINDKKLDLPSYLSVMAMQNREGEDKVLVDISRHTTKTKNITPIALFGLLQDALIIDEFKNEWNKYSGNVAFMSLSAIVYARLSVKILDKLYSVNLEPVNSDFYSYLFAKFFLLNMAGRSKSSTTDSIAHKACFNETSLKLLQEKEAEIQETNMYDSLVLMFQAVNQSPSYNVKFRSYFENFIRMYGDSTVLAMDYLPAFYQMIFSAAAGSNLAKDFIIERTIGDALLNKCYSSFSRLI